MALSFKLLINVFMTDKLKPHEILVCPVKNVFLVCKSHFRETTTRCVFQEKNWAGPVLAYFSTPLGIVGDFDLN